MVRQNVTKTNILCAFASVLLLSLSLIFPSGFAKADNTTFQVNVKEVLTVSITPPSEWATGNVETLLRNQIVLNVASNNTAGFTASMTSNSTTSAALSNNLSYLSSDTINTLSADWTRANTTLMNFWGWSTDDSGESGTYHQVVLKGAASPSVLIDSSTDDTDHDGSVSKNVYFGARADSTIASGTYSGTVIISVVTGAITDSNDNPNNNPITPTDPATPTTDPTTNNGGTVAYDSSTGYTVYTNNYVNNASSTVEYSEITSGNNSSVYSGYTYPQGVTTVNEGTPLATGLAITSAIAATTGVFLLIAAKRRKDEEEEEEY